MAIHYDMKYLEYLPSMIRISCIKSGLQIQQNYYQAKDSFQLTDVYA